MFFLKDFIAKSSPLMAISFFSKRPLIILCFGVLSLWFVLEWVLFGLISHMIGVFPTVLVSIFKGGFGIILLSIVLRRFLGSMRSGLFNLQNGFRGSLMEPSLAVLGSILICLPGFLASIVGLALFAPSFRAMIMGWSRKKAASDTIDLAQNEYHEVRRKR